MIFNTLLSAAALSSLAYAADIQVTVGASGLTYSPDTVTAAVGDTVSFHFSRSRHSVVEAAFDTPCQPLANGFGVPAQSSSDAVFTVTVTDTNPLFFYCSVAAHCQAGMVGVINPSSSQDLTGFKAKLNSASSGSQPGGVSGGVLVSGGSTVGGSPATSSAGGSSSASSGGASTSKAAATTSTAGVAASSSSGVAAYATVAPAAFAVLAGAVAGLL